MQTSTHAHSAPPSSLSSSHKKNKHNNAPSCSMHSPSSRSCESFFFHSNIISPVQATTSNVLFFLHYYPFCTSSPAATFTAHSCFFPHLIPLCIVLLNNLFTHLSFSLPLHLHLHLMLLTHFYSSNIHSICRERNKHSPSSHMTSLCLVTRPFTTISSWEKLTYGRFLLQNHNNSLDSIFNFDWRSSCWENCSTETHLFILSESFT